MDLPIYLLLAVAIFAVLDDVLIVIVSKRLGGKIGRGLKLLGVSLFVLLIYMVIDFLVIHQGLMPVLNYFVLHSIIELILYSLMFLGLWMIYGALKEES